MTFDPHAPRKGNYPSRNPELRARICELHRSGLAYRAIVEKIDGALGLDRVRQVVMEDVYGRPKR